MTGALYGVNLFPDTVTYSSPIDGVLTRCLSIVVVVGNDHTIVAVEVNAYRTSTICKRDNSAFRPKQIQASIVYPATVSNVCVISLSGEIENLNLPLLSRQRRHNSKLTIMANQLAAYLQIASLGEAAFEQRKRMLGGRLYSVDDDDF